MSKSNNLGDYLTDIANAIRTKKGTSAAINAQDFSSEIESLGVILPLNAPTLSVSVTPKKQGVDGFISATATMPTTKIPNTVINDFYTMSYVSGGTFYYNFTVDGVLKETNTTGTFTYSDSLVLDQTYTIGCYISASKCQNSQAVTQQATYYEQTVTFQMTVSGLGSSSPSSVTFTNDIGTFPTLEQVTIDGNIFIKIPTMYRKVNSSSSGQITSFTIADAQVDANFQPYPCFLKEDGVTVMPYILMGKYCSTSSSTANSVDGAAVSLTPSAGRTLCRNKGTGYLMMDWMIFKLWQDLLICKMKTIDTNSGAGINIDQLGISWKNNGSDVYPWVDGVAAPASGNNWVFSYKPSTYIDQPSSSSTGYQQVNYARPTANGNITALGYDSSYPFLNYPKTASGSTYTTYYCDRYYYSSGSRPVVCSVGGARAASGAFSCYAGYDWSGAYGVRLCYRPL